MYLPLVTGTLAATDTATSVPAGEVWMLYSITLNQPAASAANTVSLAIGGTSLTAANVRKIYSLAGGLATLNDYPGIAVAAGSSVNISATTAAQTTFTINGFKFKTV